MASYIAPLLLGGLSALGGLFGGTKSTSDSSTTTNPNFSPQQQALLDAVTRGYSNTLNNIPAFNQAYETGGVRNYLKNSINANAAAENTLNARGIDRTTAGAQAIGNTGYQEGNNIADFLTQAPIVEQQNQTDLLSKAGAFGTSIPTGTTSTSHTTATGNTPISPVAGLITGGSQGLAAALGQQTAATNLQNILKQLPTNTGSSSGSSPSYSTIVSPSGSSGDNWWSNEGDE